MEQFLETFWSAVLYFVIPALFALLVYAYAASKNRLRAVSESQTEELWKRKLASTVLELISIAETMCLQGGLKPAERYAYVMSKAVAQWDSLPAKVKAKYDKAYIESLIETGVVAQGYSSTASPGAVASATSAMKELFSDGGAALVGDAVSCDGTKPLA